MVMSSSLVLSALLALLSLSPVAHASLIPNIARSVKHIPTIPTTGPVSVQFTSTHNSLDAPKLSAVNETTAQWWYFDIASTHLAHVTVTYFTSSNVSFAPLGPISGIDTFFIWASFANGTLWESELPASEVVITTAGEGASGVWKGVGASFTGSADLSHYALKFDNPSIGLKGTITLDSIAPAHYPCGPVRPGEKLEVVPHVGWSNAMPDAKGNVDLHIQGTHLKFDGVGYHDQNWSDAPILATFSTWYWGHAHFGPYSLVWFDVIDLQGKEYVSAYVARNGRIVDASCSGLLARPHGKNSQFPPYIGSGNPDGFIVTVDLGKKGILEAKVTKKLQLVDAQGIYARYLSNVVGGFKGHSGWWSGVGINEEFTLGLPPSS